MNRTLGFGIALFFAILGIAVLGNGTEATAGHGCAGGCYASAGCNGGCGGWTKHRRRCHGGRLFNRHGCHAASSCNGGDCASSCNGCHARCHGGLFARMRARRCNGCSGYNNCCTVVDHGCDGCYGEVHVEEAAPVEPAPEVPDAPAEGSASNDVDSNVVYRSVAYRS